MELREVVDIFGQAGFDVIAITDHVVNSDSSIGKLAHSFNYTVTEDNFGEYIKEIETEGNRALGKYGMLVIPGVEITKNYISSDLSAHLLLIDLVEFIPASCDYETIFSEARRQNSLIVACHPGRMSGLTAKNTFHLWNNRDRFARHIDAWEIANRDDVFNVVSLKKYPYIANSDFHEARHLYSWKTLLDCDKDIDAIKKCIRHNRGVAITLFKNIEMN
jgi:predicted metal-dependent phosphoesterase TrpH